MRSRLATILGVVAVVALGFLWISCGTQPNCPTCGTTVNGAYGVLDIIPVPEHNPTGEPGGPFNSFDISWFDPNRHVVYTSDRIGLAVVVTDTVQNQAVNVIEGLNGVTNAGNNASPCWGPQQVAGATSAIPSIITGQGFAQARTAAQGSGLTRFGCRNAPYFAAFGNVFPGFGANGFFGGFPGAQCCASRANGVNPISGPDGLLATPDGRTLFVGSGSASVVVFDLTTNPPTVIGDFPTGSSPDFDGPVGVAPCIATWNGGAGSDPTCADDRADEMAYGTVGGRNILAIANGDPGLPFVTLIDVTDMVNRTFAPPFTSPGFGHCLPINYPAFNVVGTAANNYTPTNPPACILGQIYYDGVGAESSTAPVDASCPDPSTSVPSGVSGTFTTVIPSVTIPCHHAPIVDQNTGAFITNNGATANPAVQNGEIAVAGTGALAFNPLHHTFYVENLNCTISTLPTQSSVAVGCIDEIDPRIGNANGPVVINVIPVLNCMPAGIVQGPGNDFLVGCGGHDGVQFPPLMIIFDGTCTTSAACVASEIKLDKTGGTDEVWYNPGDNRYYTAGRDMPNGPVMGVIDAGTRTWLVNVPTNSNSHSIAADQFTNHIFVPSQSGGICGTQSSNGCLLVYGRQ